MKTKYEELIGDKEGHRLLQQEALAFAASELVYSLMEQEGISKSKLAEISGKSRAFVTQVLSGSRNMTMHTLADLMFALDHRIELDVRPLAVRQGRRAVSTVRKHTTRRVRQNAGSFRGSRKNPERIEVVQ